MADRRRTVTSPSFDPGDIGGGGSDDDSGGDSGDSGEPDGPGGGVDLGGIGGGGGGDSGDSDEPDGPGGGVDLGGTAGDSDPSDAPGAGGGSDPAPSPDPDPSRGGASPSPSDDDGGDEPDGPGGGVDLGGTAGDSDPSDAPGAGGGSSGGAGDSGGGSGGAPDPMPRPEQGVEDAGTNVSERVRSAAAELEQDVLNQNPGLDAEDVRVEADFGDRSDLSDTTIEAELTSTGREQFPELEPSGPGGGVDLGGTAGDQAPADAPGADPMGPGRGVDLDGTTGSQGASDAPGATDPSSEPQPQGSSGQDTDPAPSPGPGTPGGLGDATPGQDAVDAVADADRDAEIVDELTSGGVLSERGESGGLVPDELTANTPEGTASVDVSETRAREFAIASQEFGDDIDAGAAFGSAADPLGSGGTVTDARAPGTGDPANENAFEEFIEGGARIGTDLPAGVTQTETAVEVATNAPREIRDEGAGDVGETGVAVGRDITTRTAQEAAENPAEFGGGVAAGLLLGAGAGARGTGSLGDAVRAELDPRVGPFGTTAETRVVRGLRDRVRGDDTDTGGLTPDGDLGSGGSGQILDAETVDAGRGVSDPSIATRLRGDAQRQAAAVQDTLGGFVERARERTGGTDRGQAQLTGLTPEGDRDSGGSSSPSSFDDFDGTRRDDILAGSPRDRISDDIAERTQAQRRQFSGDFEQPFTERGGGTRTPADRATMNPDADQDSGPVADAVARRQDAEQRFDRRGDGRRDGDATTAEVLSGAFAGGLGAGVFGTPGSDTAPGLLDRPDFDVGTDPDVGTTPDVDVFTDFDFGQDISSDTDGDLDTDGDFGDPDFGRDTNGDTDPTDPTPRDRRDFDPGDNGRRDRDPIVELEDDAGTDDEQRVFGAAAVDDLIDSGLQSGSDAFEDLFGGSR